MYSIELMVAEHDNILKFNRAVRNACIGILKGEEVCTEDFLDMVSFARNYADKHHHGKEEQILFKEMVKQLGEIGNNLITHGMLVEHDMGRLFISELEAAAKQYRGKDDYENKADIIANAIGYTKLLQRHIDKENKVVYTYAERSLSPEILKGIDERVVDFEKQAEDEKVIETYIQILDRLTEKYK
ncbi:hemerythrin domain-containing protein [Clostridium oryzae]|uniref:Hemerythrin HHE cation binding domain protein n=1 Tax=Clostridium oryzae TaxID=1450648 RepID=A0A1V4IDE5_9CLOT|nr:hemerythrin domain-containing protein [Clostridium oryzae]OPJ57939.1 hemerythrin HHE cation binding domain protein [Clostridium oryzae]